MIHAALLLSVGTYNITPNPDQALRTFTGFPKYFVKRVLKAIG